MPDTATPPVPTDLKPLFQERGAAYGPWAANMQGTSEQLAGLTRNWQAANPGKPLPRWFAPLAYIAGKLNRIASGHYKPDNFQDLRVYLAFVETMQREDAGLPGEPPTASPAGATPEDPAACADPNVEAIVALLRARSRKGVAKYGKTTADNPLSQERWERHLLEELLDGAIYAVAKRGRIPSAAD